MGEQASNNNAHGKDDTPAPVDDKRFVHMDPCQPLTCWDCNRPGHKKFDPRCRVQQMRLRYEYRIAELEAQVASLERRPTFTFQPGAIIVDSAPGGPMLQASQQPVAPRHPRYHPYRRGRARGNQGYTQGQ